MTLPFQQPHIFAFQNKFNIHKQVFHSEPGDFGRPEGRWKAGGSQIEPVLSIRDWDVGIGLAAFPINENLFHKWRRHHRGLRALVPAGSLHQSCGHRWWKLHGKYMIGLSQHLASGVTCKSMCSMEPSNWPKACTRVRTGPGAWVQAGPRCFTIQLSTLTG